MSERQFTGKVAFVTGATSGIGQACAIAFAVAGAKVVCVGRKAEALKNIEQKIRELGTEALTIEADLSREEEAERRRARDKRRASRGHPHRARHARARPCSAAAGRSGT